MTAVLATVAAGSLGLAACSGAATPTATATRQVGASGASKEVVARGAELYAANCQVCHGDREGAGATGGAPLHNERGHTWHHPDAQLKEWVLNGKLPGAMPPFKGQLTEGDVEAILAFIKTWWSPDQRRTQADVSHRYQEALDRQQKGP